MQAKQAIWLLSDGRSGSTWFAELLDFHGCFHVEHEPIHCMFNPLLTPEPLLPLPSSRHIQTRYQPLMQDVLSGRYRSRRFGPPTYDHDGIVIRDIHGFFIAPQMLQLFPDLRPVVLVRHPAEVAASKMALSNWHWFSDVRRFLSDEAIIANLGDLAQYVARADTLFQRYVIGWAVMHHYFFTQIDRQTLPIIRYPSTRDHYERAVSEILADILPINIHGADFNAAFYQRSLTDRPQGKRVLNWLINGKTHIAPADAIYAETILDAFDLRWLVEPSKAMPISDSAGYAVAKPSPSLLGPEDPTSLMGSPNVIPFAPVSGSANGQSTVTAA
jgi:hypothetical protein